MSDSFCIPWAPFTFFKVNFVSVVALLRMHIYVTLSTTAFVLFVNSILYGLGYENHLIIIVIVSVFCVHKL